jgi:hypothetical protein
MESNTSLSYNDWPPGEALAIRRFAHDMMTPLTVIMGNLQLFGMRKDLPAPVEAKIKDLFNQAQNLSKLVQEVQKHAYELAWSGKSGPLNERWNEGIAVASSVLSRTSIQVEILEPPYTEEWKGEPEAWRGWFGSLLAAIATRLEHGGYIQLSSVENGWRIVTGPFAKSSFLEPFLHAMETLDSYDLPTGIVRYHSLLISNKCKPKIEYNDTTMTATYLLPK